LFEKGMSMDKKPSRRVLLRGKPIALAVSAAFLPWNHASALPQGGEVVAGQATISRPQARTMQIDQASQKAILDWRSFSIKANETVNFIQPNVSAVALNRVVGSSSSEIYGALNANGQVFLVNTNGILFAPGSSVNVGGLVATTLSISNEDFLSGNYVFQRDAGEHSRSVVNRGSIVTPNGYTALFGPQVRNEGVIIANSGSIALGAGDRVSLDLVGDNLIRLNVEQAALKASIVNTGSLLADGGTVMLKASSAGGLLDTVINTSGVIRANALVERDGAIVLDGGSSGITAVSGSLQAAGGAISVAGDMVALLGAARVDASGEAGGGSVHVDAGVLVVGANASVRADATLSGSGGQVVLAGRDAAWVHGAVSAHGAAGGAGGVVETSGGSYLNVSDAPDVGPGGTWVIASDNLVVANGSEWNSLGASLISGQLDAGANVVLNARGADGDVTINSAIGKANANSAALTLTATDAVTVNAPISLASGGLIVNADALTNTSTITNSGGVAVANNIVLNADAFNLVGGTINSGSAVILRPRTGTNSFGIEAAGDTTVTNADLASINTSNFVVFGSGMGTTFTGNMMIGQNAQVNGGMKNLAFFRSQQPGGTTTIGTQGVATGGDVIISAGGGAIVSNGGMVRGDEVQLRAREGIGSAAAPVRTAANALGIVNTSFPLFPGSTPVTGNVIVSEADNVTLRDITLNVGGIVNSTNNFSSGTMALAAGGAINIAGTVQTLGSLTLTAEDSVTVNAPISVAGGGLTVNADALVNTSAITSTAGVGIPNNIVLNADAFNLAGGTINATSAVILRPRTATNSFGIEAAGDTTVTNADLASINTNDFVVLGSGMGTTFTGNMIIGQNAQVNGGTKNLAFFRSQQPGGTITVGTQGVATGGDVIINAGGGAIVSNGGTVRGDEVQLRAREGIGSGVAPVRTAANALGIVNTSFPLFPGSTPVTGNVFVSETDNVTLRDITLNVGGIFNSTNNFSSGTMALTAGGALDIFGTVQSLGAMTLNAASITETGAGRIQAPALTTTTGGNTLLTGLNAISTFSGSSAADIILNNTGPLTVASLNAGGNASLSSAGTIALSGPWQSANATIFSSGGGIELNGTDQPTVIRTQGTVSLEANYISSATNGFVVANTLSTRSVGDTTLVGPNMVANFNGFGASTGHVTFNNRGDLYVTGMTARNATLTNEGGITLSGPWNSSAAAITTTGAGSGLTVNNLVQSFGPMTLDIAGTLRVAGSGMQNAWLTSFGGQSIRAGAIEITSDNGASAIIGNNPSISGDPSGEQTINVSGGGIIIRSNGPGGLALLTNGSPRNQSINVSGPSGIDVHSISGGNAQIFNIGPGSQAITVSGGGMDVHTDSGSGLALISTGSGVSQTINVVNGDHIAVNARSGFAGLSSGGAQSIAITGTGANAITIGSAEAAGGAGIAAIGDQSVVAGEGAEAGSITIMGSSAPRSFNGISNNRAPQSAPALHTQTVKTSGTFSALGGNASQNGDPTSFSNVGIIQNHAGKQTINANAIVLRGGSGGLNNGAFIGTNAGGDQHITVPGRIDITGGAGGNNNRAQINSAGNQRIDGNPIIVVTGGAGGGQQTSNLAAINAFNPAKEQHIYAKSIELRSGAGGVDNSATITGRTQHIETTGDVVMSGDASTGQLNGTRIGGLANPAGPTDLTLIVGGSLVMSGGSAPFSGSGIGSSAGSSPQPNNIDITVKDDVILNSGAGSGARIGSSVLAPQPSGGTISIKAGRDIKLNGNSPDTLTAIRTTDSVTLIAGGSISEGTHGRIDAASLKTESGTDTSLTGQNRINSFSGSSRGDVTLVNTLPLQILGVTAAGDVIVDNTGDVTVGGADATSATLVYAPGDVTITAPGFTIIVQGSNTTAGAGSEVRAGGTATLTGQQVLLIDGTAPDAPATVISGAAE
jgi:filamentous hemagglutinin family protein